MLLCKSPLISFVAIGAANIFINQTSRTISGVVTAALTPLAIIVLTGCANQQATRTGFIQDYSSLSSVEGKKTILASRPTPEQLSRYDSVWIQPVEIRIANPEDGKELQELARLAAKELKNEIGKKWKLVDEPGLRTLRVSTALTGVRKSMPAVNIALTVVAVPLVNGGLSAEVKILNASGKQVGALIWADEGVLNPVGYYSEYGHPRALTTELAKSVALVLEPDLTAPPQ